MYGDAPIKHHPSKPMIWKDGRYIENENLDNLLNAPMLPFSETGTAFDTSVYNIVGMKGCPYCAEAIMLLFDTNQSFSYEPMDITKDYEGTDKETGQTGVPMIWKYGRYIDGGLSVIKEDLKKNI